ncbi:immunity 51 family protein [Actinocorallia sp. API 0066]|uniref:Imm51 family immunity protein n=1 Tax=Actinocorallia sp. API 0066 TaxID=2896846 RepID=UPI001E5F6F76|nr:Imm51 family immunity protein [Actinocorallia sp. API 0066]MCD0447623.1 immunity 51 family protein [Actinocorallia sp. API 0066]
MTDRSTYAPFVFFEYDHKPGTYCLMLSDDCMAEVGPVFKECDRESDGPGWNGVARSAIESRSPDISPLVTFESEPGMFAAYSEDPFALQTLATYLQEAFQTPPILRALINTATPSWFT